MRIDTGRCREKYQTREIEDTGLEVPVVSLCRVFLTHTKLTQSNMFVCFFLWVWNHNLITYWPQASEDWPICLLPCLLVCFFFSLVMVSKPQLLFCFSLLSDITILDNLKDLFVRALFCFIQLILGNVIVLEFSDERAKGHAPMIRNCWRICSSCPS